MRNHSVLRTLSTAILPAIALAGPVFAQSAPTQLVPGQPGGPPAPPAVPAAQRVTPPVVTPVAPVMPLPTLSPAQAAWLTDWLGDGAEHGLTASAAKQQAPVGEALVRAALDRARALHVGRVDTGDFLEIWALRPAAYDPLPAFAAAVAADRLPQWATDLTPPYAGYEGLKAGLSNYEKIRDAGGWPKLVAASAPAAVRDRLLIEDKSVTATEKLADAIQRAQRRYGLNPTGQLDARTLAALNVMCGLILDTVVRGRREVRRLAYLAFPAVAADVEH